MGIIEDECAFTVSSSPTCLLLLLMDARMLFHGENIATFFFIAVYSKPNFGLGESSEHVPLFAFKTVCHCNGFLHFPTAMERKTFRNF